MVISSSRHGNCHAIEDGWRGNDLDLWILFLECLEESGEPIIDVVLKASSAASQPVFIANLDISNLPRACVAEDGGANSTPVCGGVTSEEFELVKSALDGLVNARFGEFTTIETKPAPNSEDWKMMLEFAVFWGKEVRKTNLLGSRSRSSHQCIYSTKPKPAVRG